MQFAASPPGCFTEKLVGRRLPAPPPLRRGAAMTRRETQEARVERALVIMCQNGYIFCQPIVIKYTTRNLHVSTMCAHARVRIHIHDLYPNTHSIWHLGAVQPTCCSLP